MQHHHSQDRGGKGFKSRFMRGCFFSPEVVKRKFLFQEVTLDEMITLDTDSAQWKMERTVVLRVEGLQVIEDMF